MLTLYAGSAVGNPLPALPRFLRSIKPSFDFRMRHRQHFFQRSLKIRIFVGLIAATLPG